MRPRPHATAVVLSGGGAYGAFGIGIMKALFAGASPSTAYTPLEADIYTGTSVGAFNAACLAGYPEPDGLDAVLRLEKIWLDHIAERSGQCGNGVFRIRGNPSNYLDPLCLRQPALLAGRFAEDTLAAGRYMLGRTANFLASSASLLDRTAATVDFGALVDCSPFLSLVRTSFREEDVRAGHKQLRLTATNWSTGEARYFDNSDFRDGRGYQVVASSAAIPGVFPPVLIGNDIYVDGGVTDNTPLNTAFEAGATELHVIYLDPEPQFIPLRGEPNTIDTMLRVYFLMLAGKLREDIATARWINEGLSALSAAARGTTAREEEVLSLGKISGQLLKQSYRMATVHRYFPKAMLGGDFGMLDYRLENIVRIIREGEDAAVTHDCEESQCLLPEEGAYA